MDVELYQQISSLQKIATRKIIDDFGHLINWKSRMNILDVGCGEGSTTVKIIKPFIEGNVRLFKLIAVDLSDAMISAAKRKFPNEKNIVFERMDIGDNNKLGRQYEGYFDMIISVFCVHLVPKYENWIRNISKMLKPDGQVFLITSGRSNIVIEFENMAKATKWSPYLKHINYLDSPLLSMAEGGFYIAEKLKVEGFRNLIHDRIDHDKLLYDKTYMRNFLQTFRNLYHAVPNNLIEDFLDELVERSYRMYPAPDGLNFYMRVPVLLYIADKN